MSNIEIVRLNACFEGFLKLSGVKNDKCTIKDRKNPYVYVHEGYFIEKIDFFKGKSFFQKVYTFSNGEFLKTRKFLKKHGILMETLKRTVFRTGNF